MSHQSDDKKSSKSASQLVDADRFLLRDSWTDRDYIPRNTGSGRDISDRTFCSTVRSMEPYPCQINFDFFSVRIRQHPVDINSTIRLNVPFYTLWIATVKIQ